MSLYCGLHVVLLEKIVCKGSVLHSHWNELVFVRGDATRRAMLLSLPWRQQKSNYHTKVIPESG